MTAPGRGRVWTGEQLTARLIALNGVAPDATVHAVFRATADVGQPGEGEAGYLVPGEPAPLSPDAFDFWLAKRDLAGPERLSVAVLVVREHVAANGDILWCTLEQRRGGQDGPYCGDPARIVFTGPVQLIRFYQATPDGRMTEVVPTPAMPAQAPAVDIGLAAVQQALAACFGGPVCILATRAPTVIEAMAGLSSVLHVSRPGGQEASCGLLWHGGIAVALQAAFPRFDQAPQLSPRQAAALAALLAAEGLSACDTRHDEGGLAVLACRPGGADRFLVRFEGDLPRLMSCPSGPPPGTTAAQEQWLHYIETYEKLRVRDAYRDGTADALVVLTESADGKTWRHSVDGDGVETWRVPATVPAPAGPPAPPSPAAPTPSDAAPPTDTAPPPDAAPDAAPFGAAVDLRFPALAYDIDEATRCAAQGRSTAAVLHCLRIIEGGLRAYALWQGGAGQPPPEERRWSLLLGWLRTDAAAAALAARLDDVRRAWRGARLQVGAKYTEAEAARIVASVECFVRCLADLCDEDGSAV